MMSEPLPEETLDSEDLLPLELPLLLELPDIVVSIDGAMELWVEGE